MIWRGFVIEKSNLQQYFLNLKGALEYVSVSFAPLKTPQDRERLELALLETEAEDYQIDQENTTIKTDRTTLINVRKSLESTGYTMESAGFAYIPKNYSEVTDFDIALKVYSFLEACEEDEDIESVWNNADISDALWERCREKAESSKFRT